MSKIIFTEEGTKPPAPSAGQISLYAKTDEVVYIQDSAGIETAIGTSNGITVLTGDVSASGPGSAVATVNSVGGSSAANIHSAELAANAATNLNTASTIVERDSSGNFSAGTITATFSGNLTGNVTGNLTGNVTGNVSGSSSSFTGSLSGDVTGTQSATSISSPTVTGKLLTGFVSGPNSPVLATDSVLQGIEKLQAQASASSGSAITALTGDGTATGPGSVPFTLATVNSNIGSFGSSTSIPSFTVNAKGLITAASGNVVVAPAGTLTGTTLASNVLSSSLTSVGIITSGTWNGTTIAITNGGTGQVTAAAAFAALSPLINAGDIIYENSVPAPTNLPIGTTGQLLTVVGGLPSWATFSSSSLPAITLTGNVTGSGSGGTIATMIANNVVTNGMLAQMPSDTIKGNNTGVTANASDLTVSQVNTMLGTVTTVGAIDTNANSNALFISGNTISTQSASITNPGMVNNTTQSFSGNKTFTGTIAISASNVDALTVNSTSFVVDSVNNVLGIGIQPSTSVMIDGINTTGSSKLVQMTGYGTGSTTGYRGRFARGTSGTPTAVQSGDILNALSGRGYGTSQFAAASTGVINVVAGETFTNASNQTYLQFEVTPTGSVTAAEHMRMAATGVTLGPQSSSTDMHQINGALSGTTRTITASTFTVDTTTTDYFIYTDSTSNAITITLPTATNGRLLFIQDKTGQASTNHITVTPPGAVTINGVNASILLGVNYGGFALISDGTNWTYYRLSQLPSVQALSASSIDWATMGVAGGTFTKTLSANTTFTFSNATPGQTIVVRLTNTASNYTVTWPAVRWPAAVAPTMSTGAVSDVYTFIYDGSNYYGSYVQAMA